MNLKKAVYLAMVNADIHTISALSKSSGISLSSLNNIVNGRNDNPGLLVISAIAKSCGITASKFIQIGEES